MTEKNKYRYLCHHNHSPIAWNMRKKILISTPDRRYYDLHLEPSMLERTEINLIAISTPMLSIAAEKDRNRHHTTSNIWNLKAATCDIVKWVAITTVDYRWRLTRLFFLRREIDIWRHILNPFVGNWESVSTITKCHFWGLIKPLNASSR